MSEEKKNGGFMKGCLIMFFTVIALGVISFAGCSILIGKAVEDSEKKEQALLKRVKEAPISDITWEEIDNIYNIKSKSTELQKKEYWKNYEGKKVKWSGTVTSVAETFGTLSLQVKLNPGTFTSDVLVRLKETERKNGVRLKKGDLVTFVGILDDWGTIMPVTLDHGEIK